MATEQKNNKAANKWNIPSDWEVKKLGDIFIFKNGLNKEKEFFGTGTPIVNYMDVFRNNYLNPNILKGKVTVNQNELKNFEVKKGDVFFTRTSETIEEIGMSSVVVEDVENTVFSGFVLRARPINNLLDTGYNVYCFSSENVRREITTKSTRTTRALTNGTLLSEVKLPIPPLPEQKAIAKVLSTMDELIQKNQQLIAQKEQRKKWLMQQLLTGKKRLKGFSGEWKDTELGELLKYEQPTKYLVKDTLYNDLFQIPVLTAGKTFILGFTNESDGICEDLPVIIFDDFTTASKFVDFPFKAKSSAMKLLRPKSNINLKFVYESMQLLNYQVGGHERHWISKFVYLTISCPPIEEQTAIAQVLQAADKEISLLKTKAEKLKEQKKGLMQLLLTGKKRLREV